MIPELLKRLEEEVSRWPGISVHPHRFGGREFALGRLEVGHTHDDGTVDIPFPRALHDQLLADGLAQGHHWVPDSGWTTFHLGTESGLQHALRLLRLSYIRYVLKAVPDPAKRFELESEQLQLSSKLKALLGQLVPLSRKMAA
ncbi:MAG TPA: luciferase family protein [Candidatus Angelobacter sp.]|nr:luciferase family protein [Candidatus Angelobacter sp.]